jgi:hypothetical protein
LKDEATAAVGGAEDSATDAAAEATDATDDVTDALDRNK